MNRIERDEDTSYCDPLPSIGGYEIERQIGRGGMSNVYRAKAVVDQSTVALKVLDTRLAIDSAMRQRFQREVQIIQALNHDHIVPLYGYGSDHGTPFLAMQLIDGVTIAELIQYLREESERKDDDFDPPEEADSPTRVELPSSVGHMAAACFAASRTHESIFNDIAELMACAADALDEAHRRGVVHRDIKPSNMMLDRDGRLWLTDFGLASVDEAQTVVTKTGEMIGTPHYMSPEQATADRATIDQRSDIYSLGATLYELATLSRPFQGDRFRVLMEISTGRLTPPSRVCPEIPKPLEAIILRAMEYSPKDRYQTAAELADDLRRFARGKGIAARQRRVSDHVVRWLVRNPELSVGSGVAVIAVGLLIMSIMYSHSARLEVVNRELARAKESIDQVNIEIARQSDELATNRARLRRHLYIVDVDAAYRAYSEWDVDAVDQLLSRHLPTAQEEADELLEDDTDLRGIEWHILNQLCEPPESRTLGKHDAAAREVVLLPGEQTCLTAGDDGFVRHWDLQTGQLLASHQVGRCLDSLAVTPDGRFFVTGRNDFETKTDEEGKEVVDRENLDLAMYRLDNGKQVQTYRTHETSLESVVVSPDGQWIVSADRYDDLALHRVTGERVAKETIDSRNESLGFSPDGKHIACIFRRPDRWQSFQLRSIPDLKIVQDFKLDMRPTVFSFSGDGRHILLANEKEFALCSWPEWKPRLVQRNLRDRVRCVALNHDGTSIQVGCDNGTLFVWNLNEQQLKKSGQELVSIPRMISTGPSMITSMVITERGETVLTTQSGSVQIWQTNCERKTPHSLGKKISCVARTSADSPDLIVRSSDGNVFRHQLLDDRFVKLQHVPPDDAKKVAVSRDGKYIVASAPKELVVLSGRTGEVIKRLKHPEEDDETRDLAFTADGTRLLHLMPTSFQVFKTGPDAEDWTASKPIEFRSDASREIAYSPEADRIVVITSELLVFDPESCQLIRRIPCEFGDYTSMQFSEDGNLVMLGCRDGTIELRRAADLEPVTLLRGHRDSIRRCLLVDNDQTLVSCTHDEIRFWDLSTERDLGSLAIEGSIYDMHFSPQENSLFTFYVHHPAQRWSLPNP